MQDDTAIGLNDPTSATTKEDLHMRIVFHQKALQALNSERAQLAKQLEALKAERQVLQAVAKKGATTRRSSAGTQ